MGDFEKRGRGRDKEIGLREHLVWLSQEWINVKWEAGMPSKAL